MKEYIEAILLALQEDLLTKEEAKMLAMNGLKAWFVSSDEGTN